MQQLNFPGFQYITRVEENNKTYIFDPVRKRYVKLTPEEWVRQHLINYLAVVKKVPYTLMSVESGLKVNGMMQRFDLVVYNSLGQPRMIVECKASSVELTADTMFQAARYNLSLKVDYLLI
ncbi:MAG: type I restriction enzyme HsdR N-terminal domain-containing protein, partial [Lentimicrobiaceae bacterium]|nr:type I restriction enzyme HsdR N-terminal domain-containing protein [Lentimicrobiaceae bacterium]